MNRQNIRNINRYSELDSMAWKAYTLQLTYSYRKIKRVWGRDLYVYVYRKRKKPGKREK